MTASPHERSKLSPELADFMKTAAGIVLGQLIACVLTFQGKVRYTTLFAVLVGFPVILVEKGAVMANASKGAAIGAYVGSIALLLLPNVASVLIAELITFGILSILLVCLAAPHPSWMVSWVLGCSGATGTGVASNVWPQTQSS